MADQQLLIVDEADLFAVVERIVRQHEPLAAARKFHELGKHLYWKEKNLAGCVALLRAGAQVGLTTDEADPQRCGDLRSAAKAMCYDTASFTWPGWAEPGISPAATDTAIGLDAARANLRLGEELNKGDLPLSRAHWMLAAQLLAARKYSEAGSHFELGQEYAVKANSRANVLLCSGFAMLSALLENPGNTEAAERLETIKSELAPLEHGPFFVSQIETAADVFAKTAMEQP